jgi:ABC-type branched-subunit amino acid transport system substrate-binding protein
VTRSIVVSAVCAALLSGCTKDPYKAGVWMGPTGANVSQMVASEINFSGGAGGRRFTSRVVSQRDVVQGELEPAELYASFDSMANDPSVLAIVTRVADATTERATRLFEEAGLPYLVATPVPRDYAKTHPHAFMLVPSMEDQAEFMAEQALLEPLPRRAAIINVREAFTDSLAMHVKRALLARGVQVVFTTSFVQTADEHNLVAKAAETATFKPNILFFIGRSPSLMVMHGTLLNQIPHLRIISNDLVESFHLYQNPKNIYTGVRFVRYMNPAARDSLVLAVRERMSLWIGRDELNNEAALTYDALKGIAQGIKSGATTREAMYEWLKRKPTFRGITGEVTFGEGQRINRPMHIAEVGMDSTFVLKTASKAAK